MKPFQSSLAEFCKLGGFAFCHHEIICRHNATGACAARRGAVASTNGAFLAHVHKSPFGRILRDLGVPASSMAGQPSSSSIPAERSESLAPGSAALFDSPLSRSKWTETTANYKGDFMRQSAQSQVCTFFGALRKSPLLGFDRAQFGNLTQSQNICVRASELPDGARGASCWPLR